MIAKNVKVDLEINPMNVNVILIDNQKHLM